MEYSGADHLFFLRGDACDIVLQGFCALLVQCTRLHLTLQVQEQNVFLAFARKYLQQFCVSTLWKNYEERSGLKIQLKIEFLPPYTGSTKVLENIPGIQHLISIRHNEIDFYTNIIERPDKHMRSMSSSLKADLQVGNLKVQTIVEQFKLKLPARNSHQHHAIVGEVNIILNIIPRRYIFYTH